MKRNAKFLFHPHFGEWVRVNAILETQSLRSGEPVDSPLPAFPLAMARAVVSGEMAVRFVDNPDDSTTELSIGLNTCWEFDPHMKDAMAR